MNAGFFIKSWSISHHMYAGKICNGYPISTKRQKLERVGPVDNGPSTNKDGGPKQVRGIRAIFDL